LADALRHVGARMAAAEHPWWLIGSAAMALHGIPVAPEDVDLLVGIEDADRLFAGDVAPGTPSDLFRSARFGRWCAHGFTIEVMAGLELRTGGAWRPVVPNARERIALDGIALFTPGIDGLLAMCRAFGRPKDLRRAALLSR